LIRIEPFRADLHVVAARRAVLAALLLAAATGVVASGGMTQVVSPVAAATDVSEDGAHLDLLVIWRGQAGWYRGHHSESAGGSGRTFHSSVILGSVHLDVQIDFQSRVATIGGHRLTLGPHNVVLVDDVDTPTSRIAGTLAIDAKLPETYPNIFPLLARSPEVVRYLQCDTKLDGPLESIADWCGPLFDAGAIPATPEQEVRAALAHYAELTHRMDHAAIAAMYAPDGEIVNPGQAPVRGPVAIEAFLRRFEGYQVLSELLKPDTTVVSGTRATQSGQFRQTVRAPDGAMINASGTFTVEWVRVGDGWRVQRMATAPNR
jgi:ketosteroid isomerase-like protein